MGALKLSYYENTSLTRHDEYGFLRVEPKNGVTIRQSSNYSTFGSPMPGRQFNTANYRYGFNGKENDNEVKGVGNQQDYGMRIYDPRLGRFLSSDPIGKNFAYYTTYQFAGNKPIVAIDVDGLEDVYVTTKKGNRTIMIKYSRDDINRIAAGGHAATLRVYYDNSASSIGQFEGPNKKNERDIFTKTLALQEDYIQNELVPNNLKKNEATVGYGPTKPVAIPEPAAVKKDKPEDIDVHLNEKGFVKFQNYKSQYSGKDYKGDPAGPGALGGLLVDDLNSLISSVKANGNVKEINLELTLDYQPLATINAVEVSAKNGVENIKNYLENNGLKGIKINTSSKVVEASDKNNGGDNLSVKFK